MSDRDDLVKILAPQFPKFALWTLEFVADQILAAGWRRSTVTRERANAASEEVRKHLEWLTTDVSVVFPSAQARAVGLDLAIATLEGRVV